MSLSQFKGKPAVLFISLKIGYLIISSIIVFFISISIDKAFVIIFKIAKNEYLSVNPIDPGISHSLTKKDFKTWLNDEREANINWDYSDRYFKYLLKTGNPRTISLPRSYFHFLIIFLSDGAASIKLNANPPLRASLTEIRVLAVTIPFFI